MTCIEKKAEGETITDTEKKQVRAKEIFLAACTGKQLVYREQSTAKSKTGTQRTHSYSLVTGL